MSGGIGGAQLLAATRKLVEHQPDPWRATVLALISQREARAIDQEQFETELDKATALSAINSPPKLMPFPTGDRDVLDYALTRAEIAAEWSARRDPSQNSPDFLRGAAREDRLRSLHGRERFYRWFSAAMDPIVELSRISEALAGNGEHDSLRIAQELERALRPVVSEYRAALRVGRIPWMPRGRGRRGGTDLDLITERLDRVSQYR